MGQMFLDYGNSPDSPREHTELLLLLSAASGESGGGHC